MTIKYKTTKDVSRTLKALAKSKGWTLEKIQDGQFDCITEAGIVARFLRLAVGVRVDVFDLGRFSELTSSLEPDQIARLELDEEVHMLGVEI